MRDFGYFLQIFAIFVTMDICKILELVALVAGLVYMVLQVLQKQYMWYFNLVTASASLAVTIMNRLWASAALNLYFIITSVIGIFTWRALARKDKKVSGGDTDRIRLVRLKMPIVLISAAVAIAGGVGVYFLLSATHDPSPVFDAATMILSVIAAWWLTRPYVEQWLVWLVADLIAVAMYASQGLWGMTALFSMYIISCVVGYAHWRKKGVYM